MNSYLFSSATDRCTFCSADIPFIVGIHVDYDTAAYLYVLLSRMLLL